MPNATTLHCDVAVLGSGPAGLALAAALAERGLAVLCVAPEPRRPWLPTYGMWADEESLLPAGAVAARYPKPRVWLRDDEGLTLSRGYLKLDTPLLQRGLLDRADAAGVRFVDAWAFGIEHVLSGSHFATSAGVTTHAAIVVDASGAGSTALIRDGADLDAHQTAYGAVVEVVEHPYREGEMSFMDFRCVPGTDARGAPSFLYVLPIDAHRLFVEETSLVRVPALPIADLKVRLEARLRNLGIRVLTVHEEEHCSIAMGRALPTKTQRLFGYGAAAAMVHPATGYQLATALRLAPEVADALREGLNGGSPHAAVRFAWDALWSSPRVRSWHLHRFGMAAMCTLDLANTQLFFETFFALRPSDYERYLDGTASPGELSMMMLRLFRSAAKPTQWQLLKHGVGAGRAALWNAAWQGASA